MFVWREKGEAQLQHLQEEIMLVLGVCPWTKERHSRENTQNRDKVHELYTSIRVVEPFLKQGRGKVGES